METPDMCRLCVLLPADLSPEPPCLPVLELHSRRRGGGRQEDWLEQVGQVKLGPLGCWVEPTQPATGSHYLTTCIQHHTGTTLAADREASSLPDYWEKSVWERDMKLASLLPEVDINTGKCLNLMSGISLFWRTRRQSAETMIMIAKMSNK